MFPSSEEKRPDRLYRAADEAANECEAGNSPPDTGGEAAPSRKKMRSHRSGADGVVGIAEGFRNAFFRRGSIPDHY